MEKEGFPEIEPSMDQGLVSDRYVAGRVEELEHTGNVAEPNLRGLQKLEYQREVRELVKKIQQKMPSLLPWIESYVIGVVNPSLFEEKIDLALEHIFNRDWSATPRRAANEVAHYKRIPSQRFNYVWRRAQVVKKRLIKRRQRAEFSSMEDV